MDDDLELILFMEDILQLVEIMELLQNKINKWGVLDLGHLFLEIPI